MGFLSLASKVKPGGHLSAWIYGAENNEWIVRFVNPVREKITSRIDQRALLHLSKIPAAGHVSGDEACLWTTEPATARHSRDIFFTTTICSAIAPFGWREQHTIVFDHLVAPTAFYISREEFEKWWRDWAQRT